MRETTERKNLHLSIDRKTTPHALSISYHARIEEDKKPIRGYVASKGCDIAVSN